MDTIRDIHDWNFYDTDELSEIMHQDGEGVSLTPYYLMEYLDGIPYFEFAEMLKNAQTVTRCKLCGKYFVLYDKKKRDFCDRPYKDNRTCKQVGAKLFFDKGVDADKYLTAFTVEYNKVYSRRYRAVDKDEAKLSGKDLSAKEFSKWSKLAQQARKDYLEEKISGEELLRNIRSE